MQVESGSQLFKRLNAATYSLAGINKKMFQRDHHPAHNQSIEVIGAYSRELLVDLIIRCILPPDYNTEWKGLATIFLCTDHLINTLFITQTLDVHLKKANIKNRKPIVEMALKNLIILKCYNQQQFELSILNLDKIVHQKENVSLLVIDNIAANYWIEKQTLHEKFWLRFDNYCKTNFKTLKDSIKDLNLVMVFSRDNFGTNLVNLEVDYKIVADDSANFSVLCYETEEVKTVSVNLENYVLTFC